MIFRCYRTIYEKGEQTLHRKLASSTLKRLPSCDVRWKKLWFYHPNIMNPFKRFGNTLCPFQNPKNASILSFCYRSSFSHLTLSVFMCAHYTKIRLFIATN